MAGKAAYKNQWQKENCDRINLTVPKGRKALLQAHAEQRGESVNAFINRAITETVQRDGGQLPDGTDGPTLPVPPEGDMGGGMLGPGDP